MVGDSLGQNSGHLIVILGAGHAGGRAAEALRTAGFAGKVMLVGSETHPPYERPPLSKELLAGTCAVEKTYLKPLEFWATAGIDLHLGSPALEIDRAAQRLRLTDGVALPYDSLLLTLGARARHLTIPGGTGRRVYYLRDIDDCLKLRGVLGAGKRLIVIGAGFIGPSPPSIAAAASICAPASPSLRSQRAATGPWSRWGRARRWPPTQFSSASAPCRTASWR